MSNEHCIIFSFLTALKSVFWSPTYEDQLRFWQQGYTTSGNFFYKSIVPDADICSCDHGQWIHITSSALAGGLDLPKTTSFTLAEK